MNKSNSANYCDEYELERIKIIVTVYYTSVMSYLQNLAATLFGYVFDCNY